MKKMFIAGSIALLSFGFLHAQDLNSIKTQMLLRQFKPAKEAIDKAVTADKLNKKPETWAMKAAIYSALAEDPATAKDQVEVLRNEAAAAFVKYKALDPGYALMKEAAYTSGPINLYTASFKKGVDGFNTQNWAEAYKNFVSAVDYIDFLIETKVVTTTMDTTSILYAGASAQNLKDDANASKYFTRLSDANVGGKDYEFMYQFLSYYHMTKKDEANFAKTVARGKSLYPNSKYFSAVEEDYANSKDEFYVSMREGEDLFSKLYPKLDKDIPPGDNTEMETKMIAAFKKAADLKPEKAGMAFTNIGNHFVNKSVAVNLKINAVNDGIKALNKNAVPDKTGKMPPPPKDSLAKKEILFKEYDGFADQAIAAYEKAAEFYAKKAEALSNIEKQAYKNSVSYLIDLYAEKKKASLKSKPAESAKFAAQEKKWDEIYTKIK